MNTATYLTHPTLHINLITGEKITPVEAVAGGVNFRIIETGEAKFYTNHQIKKLIRKAYRFQPCLKKDGRIV